MAFCICYGDIFINITAGAAGRPDQGPTPPGHPAGSAGTSITILILPPRPAHKIGHKNFIKNNWMGPAPPKPNIATPDIKKFLGALI